MKIYIWMSNFRANHFELLLVLSRLQKSEFLKSIIFIFPSSNLIQIEILNNFLCTNCFAPIRFWTYFNFWRGIYLFTCISSLWKVFIVMHHNLAHFTSYIHSTFMYRVSHSLVLNFDFNFWLFWLSYQKKLVGNKNPT